MLCRSSSSCFACSLIWITAVSLINLLTQHSLFHVYFFVIFSPNFQSIRVEGNSSSKFRASIGQIRSRLLNTLVLCQGWTRECVGSHRSLSLAMTRGDLALLPSLDLWGWYRWRREICKGLFCWWRMGSVGEWGVQKKFLNARRKRQKSKRVRIFRYFWNFRRKQFGFKKLGVNYARTNACLSWIWKWLEWRYLFASLIDGTTLLL